MDITACTENGRMYVVAKPNARRSGLLKIVEGVAHIAVAAPPENNRANRELERVVSKLTGKNAKIVSGFSGRRKTLLLE